MGRVNQSNGVVNRAGNVCVFRLGGVGGGGGGNVTVCECEWRERKYETRRRRRRGVRR